MILIPSVLHVVVFLGMLSEIQKIVEGSARYMSVHGPTQEQQNYERHAPQSLKKISYLIICP